MMLEIEKTWRLLEKRARTSSWFSPSMRVTRIVRASQYNSLQNTSDFILFYQQHVNSLTLTLSVRNSGRVKI